MQFSNFWPGFDPDSIRNGRSHWGEFLFAAFKDTAIHVGSVFGSCEKTFDVLFSGECIRDIRHDGRNFVFTRDNPGRPGRAKWFIGIPAPDHPRALEVPLFYPYWAEYARTNPPAVLTNPDQKEFGISVVVRNLWNGDLSLRRAKLAHALSLHVPVHANRGFAASAPANSRVQYHDVPDKLAFISRYTHHLSFENSSWPGYLTEKVFDPLFAGTVPLYEGDPNVGRWIDGFIDCRGLEADQILHLIHTHRHLVGHVAGERTALCRVPLDLMRSRIRTFAARVLADS